MGIPGSVGRQLVPRLAPKVASLAPGLTTSFVREALHRAIEGAGPFAPARKVAAGHLADHDGNVKKAVHSVIDSHVRLAGAQGFATNLGGLMTMTVTVPANITGLAIVQCRMVAAIAHLRGYDLDDARVRNAILATLLGEDAVKALVAAKKLPAPPMALATAPAHHASIDAIVSGEVATDLIARVAGKRLATTIGRRVPVIGGLVGMGADGLVTWQIGSYADRELLPRAKR